MITTTTAVDALALALAAARRDGIEVRSIKDLLCDACGDAVALRAGYCHACADELAAHHDATATAHAAATVEALTVLSPDAVDFDGARWCVGDDEGEALARGIRC
jgi:hypothetical protein